MKKFFVGLFAGLIGVFGSITVIGSKSSFNNFNEFKTVQNAIVISNDDTDLDFILDGTISYNSSKLDIIDICSFVVNDVNSNFIYWVDGIEYSLSYINDMGFSTNTSYRLVFGANDGDYFDSQISFGFLESENNTEGQYLYNSFIYRDYCENKYYFSYGSNVISNVDSFRICYYDSIYLEENAINDYIGSLTSLPSLPSPPSPPSNNFFR